MIKKIQLIIAGILGFIIISCTIIDIEKIKSDIEKKTNIPETVSFTLTYDKNGAESGVVPDLAKHTEGSVVTVSLNSGNLVKAHYTFAGWNTVADGKGTNYTAGTGKLTLVADTILYAQWTIDRYTVTFATDGGSAVDSQAVIFGEKVTSPVAITKSYNIFAGWYKDNTFVSVWDFDIDTVESNTTLYAKWTINSYSVTCNTDGGSAVDLQTVNYGQKVSSPVTKKTGYTFGGWYKDNAFKTVWDFDADVVVANTTLYAKWTINEYTVMFNTNGSGVVVSQTLNYGQKVVSPVTITKTGYAFGGWYKDNAFQTEWVFSTDIVEADTTLYAKWTINVYSVTFNTKGGSIVVSQTIPHGSKVATPDVTSRDGYTFQGWYKEDACINYWNFTSDIVEANTTLYAKWIVYVAEIVYEIGDTGPAGGKIFYVNPDASTDGWKYLEVAPLPSPQVSWYYWSDIETVAVGGTSIEIGSGITNTALILSQAGHTNSAAKICDDFILNTFTDWFLPSKNELDLLDFKDQGCYWSSSEGSATTAWQKHMDATAPQWFDYNKYDSGPEIYVRPVRRF